MMNLAALMSAFSVIHEGGWGAIRLMDEATAATTAAAEAVSLAYGTELARRNTRGNSCGKVYLTRQDRGVTKPIRRPRKPLVAHRSYKRMCADRNGEVDLVADTRLTFSEFDGLLRKRWVDPDTKRTETLHTLIARPRNISVRGKRRFSNLDNQNRVRKNPCRLSVEDQLLLFLYSLSTPMTNKKLGRAFGVSATMAHDIYYHVCDSVVLVLYDGPDKTVAWPTAAQRAADAKRLIGLRGCFGYIDGTRVRHRKPGVNQGRAYSGKTKFHCR